MVESCNCGEEEKLASLAAVQMLLSSLSPANVLTAHPPAWHTTLHQTRSRIQRLIGADRRRMVDTPTGAADNPAKTRSRILLRGAHPNRGPALEREDPGRGGEGGGGDVVE